MPKGPAAGLSVKTHEEANMVRRHLDYNTQGCEDYLRILIEASRLFVDLNSFPNLLGTMVKVILRDSGKSHAATPGDHLACHHQGPYSIAICSSHKGLWLLC